MDPSPPARFAAEEQILRNRAVRQQIDFLASQMRSVWPEVKDLVLSGWKIELKRQLRFGIGQSLPSKTRQTCILDDRCFIRRTQGHGQGLQTLGRAQYGVPAIGSCSDGQMDRLSLLFGDLESACKEFLLLQAEKLIVSQFVFASPRTL